MSDPKRINKYLSEIGYCSRRAADKLLDEGRITINGEIPIHGTKVTGDDKVAVDGVLVKNTKTKFTYLALNKPVGIVCTTDTKVEKDNIIDFVNYHKRIFPLEDLTNQVKGLILLTDDGDIVNKILRASNNHEKEYVVSVDKPISQTFLKRMANGVPILDQITKPCKIKRINSKTFKIILTQGLNRQIRRMCEYFGYDVITLKRTRIMNIELDIPTGEYRELSSERIENATSSFGII